MRNLVVLLVACLAVAGCTTGAPPEESDEDYVRSIVTGRQAKDSQFSASDDPVPRIKHQEFLPLAYFAPDPAYRVPAVLKLSPDRQTVMMPTSTGTNRAMQTLGTLEFTLKGQGLTLGAFAEAGSTRLFVPFTDMTSGTETYPAGRYLDLEPTATGIYVIDFNLAYHPYCYFNARYECPYPPPSNRLKIPVHAGEKLRSLRPSGKSESGKSE